MSEPTPPRACRYGHGPLTRAPGLWALTGIDMKQRPNSFGEFSLNASIFGAALWRCPTCGYLELWDDADTQGTVAS